MAENKDLDAGTDTEKTTTKRASTRKAADTAEKTATVTRRTSTRTKKADAAKGATTTTRRRVRASASKDEDIPSISIADELSHAHKAAADTADLAEPVTFDAAGATAPAGDEPAGEYGSFSSFVSELKGDGPAPAPRKRGRPAKAAEADAEEKPARTRTARAKKTAEADVEKTAEAAVEAEAEEKPRRGRTKKKDAEAARAAEKAAASETPSAEEENDGAGDEGDGGSEVQEIPPLDEETANLVEQITKTISRQEQRASSDDDMTPFLAHFQYGDGRVETCVIGTSDAPAVFCEAEPDRTTCFFRTCRHVQVQDGEDTPLPAEGFWIPPHPAPKAPQQQKQEAPLDNEAEARTMFERAEAAARLVPGGRAPRVLLCWVGKVDISASLRQDTINPGPIRMLLEHMVPFDFVVVLTAQNQNVVDTLQSWLSPVVPADKLMVRRTTVHDLTDHAAIAKTAQEVVEGLKGAFNLPDNGEGLVFHLSPGSPVTHAVLLLLASTRYKGITLMSTKLTGVGKDPDILTISVADMLGDFVPDDAVPNIHSTKPAVQSAEPRTDRKRPAPAPIVAKPRHKFKAKDLIQRFRGIRGKMPASTPKESRVQVVGLDGGLSAVDFELPQAAHEENSLRAPQVSIGKPTRISATALQPGPGDPPSISHALGEIYKRMSRVASMYVPILLLGESGTGKSRLARFLHEWSARSGKFVSLDCAGLTDEMFYVELFGRAGIGSVRPREGAFRRARSGTLFLENVNRLTPTQQSMIVRILAPIGETKVNLPQQTPYPACQARVRIIASSDPGLLTDVRQGRFRTDLYYRLAGVSTVLPPVRDYTYEERENLLRSFLVALQQKIGVFWNFSGDAWQTLIDEKWPGNLREVSRALQQICLFSDAGSTITREQVLRQLRQGRVARDQADFEPMAFDDPEPAAQTYATDDFGPIMESGPDDFYDEEEETGYIPKKKDNGNGDFFVLGSGQNLDDTLSNMRMAKIAEAMAKTNGNRNEAAKLLGLSNVQLNYTLKHMQEEGDD